MDKIKPPVIKGQKIEIEIEGISHDGSGVGRINGFTVFIPDTAPGDIVTAGIISVQKSHARALPVFIREYSPARVTPLCVYFERCGGCQLQHINYGEQLRLKEHLVKNALQRIGGINNDVLPIIGMEQPWNYRNKAQVPLAWENNTLKTGFYEKHTHKIVDIDSCTIQHENNNHAIKVTRQVLEELKIPVYNEKDHTGIIRHIIAKTSLYSGETLIILVTRELQIPQKKQLITKISSRIKNLAGIIQNINHKKGNVILGKQDNLLFGKPYITEKLGDYLFYVSPRSFFQINPIQTEILYDLIFEHANLSENETVFDLYCGIGTIAIYLSKKAKKVIGVESEKNAVKDAQKNASINKINNVEFYTGKAEEIMAELINKGNNCDLVIIDPPRKGCEQKLLDVILENAPAQIIYVSCNPATLARDLKHLTAKYLVKTVQPIDMFPQTSHVECMVKLLLKK